MHETNPGQFFPITEPITYELIDHLRAATKQLIDRSAAQGSAPILVFEFRPGEELPGGSQFGSCYDLANFISTKLEGAKRTVAYVPEPLRGYAVLAALACDEIVMGPDASLGPITPEGQPVNPALPRAGPEPRDPQGCATPTCSWGCSTATPTCRASGRPTSSSITSWPRTCPSSRGSTR